MRSTTATTLLFACLFAVGARAEPPVETDEGIQAQSFLTLQHHGYFRMRSDLFINADLGNSMSQVRAPLNADSDTLAGVNVRFRWEPELRIGQRLRIHTTVDILDNLVLGSTPDFGRPDAPLTFLSQSQTDFSDAIRVKEMWAEWDFLNAIVMRFGRMSSHFGLGIADNAGACIDCDHGDYVDRVSALVRAFGFFADVYFDAPFDGGLASPSDPVFGQAYDVASVDDILRWGFDFGYTPRTAEAIEQRRKDLGSGEVVFDAAMRNTFTSQTLHSDAPTLITDCVGRPDDFECIELRKREADLWQGDIWLRLQWRPSFDMLFRAELEVAAVVGDVGVITNSVEEEPSDSAKDFLSIGGALQLELVSGKVSYELELGVASGDDVVFGPYGRGFTAPDDEYFQSSELKNNRTVTSFLFDRDYHVDQLLYREVIGAVTNSLYVKPTVRAHLFESGEDIIGGRISGLYGHALVPESVPGQEAPLGLEAQVAVFYEATGVGRAEVAGGVLVPLAGLNAPDGTAAEPAFTVQARISMRF